MEETTKVLFPPTSRCPSKRMPPFCGDEPTPRCVHAAIPLCCVHAALYSILCPCCSSSPCCVHAALHSILCRCCSSSPCCVQLMCPCCSSSPCCVHAAVHASCVHAVVHLHAVSMLHLCGERNDVGGVVCSGKKKKKKSKKELTAVGSEKSALKQLFFQYWTMVEKVVCILLPHAFIDR